MGARLHAGSARGQCHHFCTIPCHLHLLTSLNHSSGNTTAVITDPVCGSVENSREPGLGKAPRASVSRVLVPPEAAPSRLLTGTGAQTQSIRKLGLVSKLSVSALELIPSLISSTTLCRDQLCPRHRGLSEEG